MMYRLVAVLLIPAALLMACESTGPSGAPTVDDIVAHPQRRWLPRPELLSSKS